MTVTAADLAANLDNPVWRINHLYQIIIKGDDDEDDDGLVIQFKMNRAQKRLVARLHNRNLILKARQMGFSTLVCIVWLDTALFSKNPIRCGIIAQDREAAESLFRGKILYAYDNLPEPLRNAMPVTKRTASEIEFGHNGSSIRVATSMRSGTIHRLHVSEFGKICAKYPDKAKEVVTGSIPAVPTSGILIIESTAEGQEGAFYEMSERARALHESGAKLSAKDYQFHFFPWWEAPEYVLPAGSVPVSSVLLRYFTTIEGKICRKLSEEQRAWYAATVESDFSGDQSLMWQEYPSFCVVGDTYVSTQDGMVKIRDIKPDGKLITRWMDQGIKHVFKLRTKLGYSLTCTADHRVLCENGEYVELQNLSVGDRVRMAAPSFGDRSQVVAFNPQPFVRSEIEITPEFALFLGLYMGDGSFYNGCVSIACDAGDTDTVIVVEQLMTKFLGGANSRATGTKQGCLEVRRSSVGLYGPFIELGIIKKRDGGDGYKRNVHIPGYIMQSPRHVAASFLKGLFEADGFASRDGCSIKFFTKYENVALDVQRLLLAFGIESRASKMLKKSGEYQYEGWELVLRANGVRQFAKEIGFVSERKQGRANLSLKKRKTGAVHSFDWCDSISSIEPAGEEPTYDITTSTGNFIAGGIVVHNCEEAFQVSTEGCYYAEQLSAARKGGRILKGLPLVPVPVNTFWDLGRGDMTTIWCHQFATLQDRFHYYYENSGEDLVHYVTELQRWAADKRVTFGIHYLPHEADYKRLGKDPDTNQTLKEMLEELWPNQRFEIVPRISNLQAGITATRQSFSSAWFDEEGCAQGLKRVGNYRKKWNKTTGCWSDQEQSDDNAHGADALRQWGQEKAAGNTFSNMRAPASTFKRRGSPMSV